MLVTYPATQPDKVIVSKEEVNDSKEIAMPINDGLFLPIV